MQKGAGACRHIAETMIVHDRQQRALSALHRDRQSITLRLSSRVSPGTGSLNSLCAPGQQSCVSHETHLPVLLPCPLPHAASTARQHNHRQKACGLAVTSRRPARPSPWSRLSGSSTLQQWSCQPPPTVTLPSEERQRDSTRRCTLPASDASCEAPGRQDTHEAGVTGREESLRAQERRDTQCSPFRCIREPHGNSMPLPTFHAL